LTPGTGTGASVMMSPGPAAGLMMARMVVGMKVVGLSSTLGATAYDTTENAPF